MTTKTTATPISYAEYGEALKQEARAQFTDGVVVPLDDERAAALGKAQELPSLAETFDKWLAQQEAEQCEDYAVDFRDLLLAPDGRIDMGLFNPALAQKHGTNPFPTDAERLPVGGERLPMTYRTFGNVVRHYCDPPRNSAKNLISLPREQDPHGHTARTMRAPGLALRDGSVIADSPRASAYNSWLDKKKRADQTVTALTGEPVTTVLFRSRKLIRRDAKGVAVSSPRVNIAVVSPTHCLRDGDDDKLIAALQLAFAGMASGARARYYRGVDESELRVLFPALTVTIPDAGEETWSGYVTARNSESGRKSWSISAGLYREKDGASVACEAIIRMGMHVGKRVPERMVEIAEGAAKMLKELAEKAAELSARTWTGTEEQLLAKLRATLSGTVLHDPDTCCGIAWAIGEAVAPMNDAVSVGMLMDILGRSAAACARRVDARPVEVMLGRVLTNGWSEFKSVAEKSEDGTDGEEV